MNIAALVGGERTCMYAVLFKPTDSFKISLYHNSKTHAAFIGSVRRARGLDGHAEF